MRKSCNGCRVLRKGCSEYCVLRPCLQWINTAESQANATIFLAKFYGRAGLVNLISSGPEHLRPAIFRSLMYEACGRMVNPIYGSLGLLCSGDWAECQAGVDSILNGSFPAVTQADTGSDHIVPIEAMANAVQRTRARSRLKGLSSVKCKGKEGEDAAISNHMDSNSKSDHWDFLINTFRNIDSGKLHEKYEDKYSMLPGQIQEQLVPAQPQTLHCHDLCNPKTSESEAPCNAVGLELTLGSKVSSPHTPDNDSAGDLRWSQAQWDWFMEK